jgi:hypothetical protein
VSIACCGHTLFLFMDVLMNALAGAQPEIYRTQNIRTDAPPSHLHDPPLDLLLSPRRLF